MEFDFTSLAFGGEQHIVAWDAKRIGLLKPDDQQNLAKVLDVFGKKSAVAQGLQTPITDILRLRTKDQRLYLYMFRQSSKTVVLGGLKVGTKRLYIRTVNAELREIDPVCVLDFYVDESCQRQGVGKALFEHFLQAEGFDPSCLAYDRPSPKLLAFLHKHYGLKDYVPQSNNYVVFNRYFELNPVGTSGSRGGQGRLNSRGFGSSQGTPHVHPLMGQRAAPPQLLAAAPVHPGWAGAGAVSAPTPSSVGPQSSVGHCPSFGQRWAASTFGSTQSPFPTGPLGSESGMTGAQGGLGTSLSGSDYGHGDALDAFSRAYRGSPPQMQPPRLQAPWEGPPAGYMAGAQAKNASYTSRPPWAVDEAASCSNGSNGAPAVTAQGVYSSSSSKNPASVERLGTSSSVAARGPLQNILATPGSRDGVSSGGGPHLRALQQQVAALQGVDGSGSFGQAAGELHPQQQWSASGMGATPAPASRGGPGADEPAASGRTAAKIMAVAQRSGAGAADCLVW